MINRKYPSRVLCMAALLFSAITGNVAGQLLPDSQEKQDILIKLRHNIIGSPTYLVNLDSQIIMIDTTTVKSLDKNWIRNVIVRGKKYEELSKQYPDKHLVLINIKRRYREHVYTWLSNQNE